MSNFTNLNTYDSSGLFRFGSVSLQDIYVRACYFLSWSSIVSGLFRFGFISFRVCFVSGLFRFGPVTFRVYFISGLFRFGFISFRACFVSGLFRFGAVSIQVGPVSFRACFVSGLLLKVNSGMTDFGTLRIHRSKISKGEVDQLYTVSNNRSIKFQVKFTKTVS